MSKLAKELFDGLKRFREEVGAELSQKNELARSELTAALFKGDAYVMYGPSQRSASVEQEHSLFGSTHSMPPQEYENQQDHALEQQHEQTMERER